jgi:molybdopterin-containing oxidoreductase family membrane subunit
VTSFRLGTDVYTGLRKLLVWFVAADAFLLFTEVMTTFVSGEPDHREQLDILLTGRLAPVFWAEIVLGLLAPVVILVTRQGRRPGLIAASSVLLLLGVFAKRINILFAAEFQPLVGLEPGIPGGRAGQSFRPDEVYVPTWVEAGVLIGMTAFFLTVITIGVQRAVLPHHDARSDQS